MPEIYEYLKEKLDSILEFLTGSKGYKVREVRERVPHILPGREIHPVSNPDAPCDKY